MNGDGMDNSDETVFRFPSDPPRGGGPASAAGGTGSQTSFQFQSAQSRPAQSREAQSRPAGFPSARPAASATPRTDRGADGPAQGAPGGTPAGQSVGAGGPFTRAATEVLMSAANLRTLAAAPDVGRLRALMADEMQRFRRRLEDERLPDDQIDHAHYAVCATIDDFVLNTPWGGNSLWTKQGMVATFHSESVGGERFFDNLTDLKTNPGRNAALLELMYACLSLGFQGHARITPNGLKDIDRQRDDLYRLLRRNGGDTTLSPRWRGLRQPARRLDSVVPSWVIAAVGGGALLLAYAGFALTLGSGTEAVSKRLRDVAMRAVPLITRPPLPPPPVPKDRERAPRIKKFLEAEIADKLVEVTETMDSVIVRIHNRGLFASASATVEPSFEPTLQRIARALEDERGKVTIVGHTDSLPIRSLRFPSNTALSLARAEAVRALMARLLSDPGRLSAQGRGDAEPIAPNTTEKDRQANRRVDIVLAKGDGQ